MVFLVGVEGEIRYQTIGTSPSEGSAELGDFSPGIASLSLTDCLI